MATAAARRGNAEAQYFRLGLAVRCGEIVVQAGEFEAAAYLTRVADHLRAYTALADQEALVDQPGDRLPHSGAAEAVRLRKVHLVAEPGTDRQFTALDRRFELLRELNVKRRATGAINGDLDGAHGHILKPPP